MKLSKLNILTILLSAQLIVFAQDDSYQLTPEEKLVDNEDRIKNLIKQLDHFSSSHDEPITKQDYDSLINLVDIFKLQVAILELEVDILKNHDGDLNAADSNELNRLNALSDQLDNTKSLANSNTTNNNYNNSQEDQYTTTEITQITKTTHSGSSAQFKKELEEIKAYQEHMDGKLDKLYLAIEAMNNNPNLALASGYDNSNNVSSQRSNYDPESKNSSYPLTGRTTTLTSADPFIKNPQSIEGYAFIVIEAQNADYKILVAHEQAAKAGINTKIVFNEKRKWYYLVMPKKYSDEDSQAALKEIRASGLSAWRYIL